MSSRELFIWSPGCTCADARSLFHVPHCLLVPWRCSAKVWPVLSLKLLLNQGSQTLGPHVAREGVLCGPRCFSGILKYLTFTLPSALKTDAAKWMNQSWMIPSAVFTLAIALQTKISLSSKFLRNLGSMPKTFTHVLSTSRKHTTRLRGSSWEKLWWVLRVKPQCRPPVIDHQVTVFLLGSLCPCRES